MKTAFVTLNCQSVNDTYSIISQLNRIAKDNNENAPFKRFLYAASKKTTTGIDVLMVNCSKKELVIALRDLLSFFKGFHINGYAEYYDSKAKNTVKLINLPIDTDDTEALDKINQSCHSKFSFKDLDIN